MIRCGNKISAANGLFLSFLLLGWLLPAAVSAKIPERRLLGKRIVELESKSSLTGEDSYKLGSYHLRLGDYYSTLARTIAFLTIDASQCLIDHKSIEWGAEYLAALSAFELGKSDQGQSLAKSGSGKKNAPAVLKDLSSILKIAAKNSNNARGLSWDMFNPQTSWAALEAGYQVARQSGNLPPGLSLEKETISGGVDYAPLAARIEVLKLLAAKNGEKLRKLLNNFEEEGMPQWEIKTSASTPAVLGDPALARLVSRAHYFLAELDLQKAASSSNAKLVDYTNKRRIKIAFKVGDFQLAEKLLGRLSGIGQYRPYKGWVAWMKGDQAGAETIWQKCMDVKDHLTASELLLVWAAMPDISFRQGNQFRMSLISSLGDLRNQARTQSTKEGRSKIRKIFIASGFWLARNEVADSASFYYGKTREKEQVNLDERPVDLCAEYLSAMVLSGAWDFRQEGLEGWYQLVDYFPSTQSVIDPLKFIINCDVVRIME